MGKLIGYLVGVIIISAILAGVGNLIFILFGKAEAYNFTIVFQWIFWVNIVIDGIARLSKKSNSIFDKWSYF